ncbi:hypothetical protein [Haloferax sp. ATB1]|uniref:hypothetical protein n=1 Tax=Haloferax sp. ATB1 TaxID=1508454 RepID=UPI00069391EC|nr:hypothetical protein [Haloferax sp. ATB1]
MLRIASTYAAVGLSVAAAYLAGVHGEISAGLAVALVAAFFFVLRVTMIDRRLLADLFGVVPRGVKVMGKRVTTLALIGVLVTTSTASPAVAATGEDCTTLDGFIYDIFNFQPFDGNSDNPCSTQYQVDQAVQDLKDAQDNQTKVDLYNAALSQKATTDAGMAPFDNYLSDTQSVAWQKAQVAVAEAYQNNSTEAQAKQAASDAIADYYATKQKNLIESYNATVSSSETLWSTADTEGLHTTNQEWVYIATTGKEAGDDLYYIRSLNHTSSVTLVNGDVRDSRYLYLYDAAGDSYDIRVDGNSTNPSQNGYTGYGVGIQAPDSNYTDLEIWYFEDYHNRWDKIETQTASLQSEADNFVNATYSDFESGAIDPSDVISANTAMFEYATRTGNNSTLYSSTAALSLMGFDTPRLNSSGVMNVSYQNQTYQGLILARNAPGGAWESNTTYNTANISGPVFMATVTGNKVDFANNTTFTIHEMTAKDGSNIQKQETTKYVYRTANTSELLEVQQSLLSLRSELEEREALIGSGGDAGVSISAENKALIALVAVALIVVFRG